MEAINKLFSLKKQLPTAQQDTENENEEVQVRVTYYQSGHGAALKANGNALTLKACLQNVYSSFEEQCRRLKEEQHKLKQPYIQDKAKQEGELRNAETALSIHQDKLHQQDLKIEAVKQDIETVRSNPEKHGVTDTKQPHALFYIGLLLLIPITIYLFVFYISATYSALFKVFSDDSLSTAIFDSQALNDAFSASWLEGVLVITIPTVFLGLGYIIHMMQKGKGMKNLIRLAGLFLITFLFDGLLAYQIEKKIYDFNKTPTTPPYNLKVAIGEAEFWMIIFAGFVVYIIWGLVFDFVMKEYENIDKIKAFIRNKQQELQRLGETRLQISTDIEQTKQLISTIKGKIEELQNKIDGFILNVKQYLHYHNQYVEGWLQAINGELVMSDAKKHEMLNNCTAAAEEHLKELDLLKPQHQHLIYSKVS
jgi:ribosome-associated translation inhibitor RaiA